jgi:hypothetical protein
MPKEESQFMSCTLSVMEIPSYTIYIEPTDARDKDESALLPQTTA